MNAISQQNEHPSELVLDAVQNGIAALEQVSKNDYEHAVAYSLCQLATSIGSTEVAQTALETLPNGKPKAIGYAKIGAITLAEADAFMASQEFITFAAVNTATNKRNEYCIASDAVEVYSHFAASGLLHGMAQKYSIQNDASSELFAIAAAPYFSDQHIAVTSEQYETPAFNALMLIQRYEQNAQPHFVETAMQRAYAELTTAGKLAPETQQSITRICTALMDLNKPQEAEAFLRTALANDTYFQLDHMAEFPLRKTQVLPVRLALQLNNPTIKAAEVAKTYALLSRQVQLATSAQIVTELPAELQKSHAALQNFKLPARPKKHRWFSFGG